jgi:hypothetical protein
MGAAMNFLKISIGAAAFLTIAGCTQVEFVSPYSAEISKKIVQLHDEVVEFEVFMRRNSGLVAGDPRTQENLKRFDRWSANIETLVTMSSSSNPRLINCQRLMDGIGRSANQIGLPDDLSQQFYLAPGEPISSEDCQTFGIALVGLQIRDLKELFEANCKIPGQSDRQIRSREAQPSSEMPKVSLPGCTLLWERPAASAVFAGIVRPYGAAIDPVLRSIRAVIEVQSRKNPNAKT